MLTRLRDVMAKNPWIGWVLALLLLGVSVGLYFLRTRGDSPYSPDRMKEMVTIRYTDTNEVEKIPRGRLDVMLRRSGGKLDPSKGIVNPKTGQPTGFLEDSDAWEEMVNRINAEAEAAAAAAKASGKREMRPVAREAIDPSRTPPAPPAAPAAPTPPR